MSGAVVDSKISSAGLSPIVLVRTTHMNGEEKEGDGRKGGKKTSFNFFFRHRYRKIKVVPTKSPAACGRGEKKRN